MAPSAGRALPAAGSSRPSASATTAAPRTWSSGTPTGRGSSWPGLNLGRELGRAQPLSHTGRGWTKRNRGGGEYPGASHFLLKFPHLTAMCECLARPTASLKQSFLKSPPDQALLSALMPLPAHSELFVSYVDESLPGAERRKFLRSRPGGSVAQSPIYYRGGGLQSSYVKTSHEKYYEFGPRLKEGLEGGGGETELISYKCLLLLFFTFFCIFFVSLFL